MQHVGSITGRAPRPSLRRPQGARAVGLAIVLATASGTWAACTTSICVVDPLDSSKCTISTVNTVDNGCVLDFGAKNVTVTKPAKLQTAASGQSFTVKANYITLKGTFVAQGGTVTVRTTAGAAGNGGFKTDKSGSSPGKVDVRYGGTLDLVAEGPIDLLGSELTADGGSAHDGGTIKVSGTTVTVTCSIDADGSTGGSGGYVELDASGDLSLGGLTTANAEGPVNGSDPSYGGTIVLSAGGALTVTKNIQVKGDQDGDGGEIQMFAGGAASLSGNCVASGIGQNGGANGGQIAVDADSVSITAGSWTATGNYGASGGEIDIVTGSGGLTMASASSVDVSGGGFGGGDGGRFSVWSGGAVTLAAAVTADAGGDGSSGGDIDVRAGGTLAVSSILEAKSTTSDGDRDGSIGLRGTCAVNLTGTLRTRNTFDEVGAGEITVEYGSTFAANGGTMRADDGVGNVVVCPCVDTSPADGTCDAPAHCATAPNFAGATIVPTATTTPTAHPVCN